jgi:hypothetical protein
MNIAKGKIGNALTSTAKDHVVVVTNDIYDEELNQYQSVLNKKIETYDENSIIIGNDIETYEY